MSFHTIFAIQLVLSLAFAANVHDATPGEIPYQLSLQAFNKHYCGAVLTEVNGIQVALTGANCMELDKVKPYIGTSGIQVVGGFLDLNEYSNTFQSREVKKSIIHESFNPNTMENDIALLLLKTPFRPSINVSTIPLPNQSQGTSGQMTLSGWGRMFHGGPNPSRPQVTQVPIINDSTCKTYYPTTNHKLFCSTASTGYNNYYCNADSGSPARAAAGYLAGVVSFLPSQTCSDANMPQAYVEVSKYVNWIKQKVNTQS